jgi:hypothetical protein
MKLYTEEQVKEAIMMARITQGVLATTFFCDEHEVFEKITPIELPSNEEVMQEIQFDLTPTDITFLAGINWMRDKILGGNK